MAEITVISVYPHQCKSQFEYGRYVIPALEKGEEYASFTISERQTPEGYGAAFSKLAAGFDEDKGVPKFFMRPIPGREIAENMVRDNGHLGVLVIEGDTPTAEELSVSRGKLTDFYIAMVNEADRAWARHAGRPEFISPLMREAGLALYSAGHPMMTEKKAWLDRDTGTQMQDCRVCGSRIKAGVLKCPKCAEWIDREKAMAEGHIQVAPPAPEPVAVAATTTEPLGGKKGEKKAKAKS